MILNFVSVIISLSIIFTLSCTTSKNPNPANNSNDNGKTLINNLHLGISETQINDIVSSDKTCCINDIYNGFAKHFFKCGSTPITQNQFISMINNSIEFANSQSDSTIKRYFSFMFNNNPITLTTQLNSSQTFILISSMLAFPVAVKLVYDKNITILGKKTETASWGQFILGATTEVALLGGTLTYGAVIGATTGAAITAVSLPAVAVIGIGALAFWAGWQIGEGLADIWNDVNSTIEAKSVPGSFGIDVTGYAIYEPSIEISAPVITKQPESKSVSIGQSVTFTVVATGNPTPTYQWKKNGSNITGAISNTFNISSVQSSDAGLYTVVVTNNQGSITSTPVNLTISETNIIPTNGLLAYYKFNGNANDSSGKNNHGTAEAIPTTDRFNKANSAYYLDGNGDSIYADIINLPIGNSSRTISAFIKIDASPATDGYIAGWGAGGTDKGFYLNHYQGYFRVITFNNDIQEFKQITTGKWIHFVATYDADTMRAYIDTIEAAKKHFNSLVTTGTKIICGIPSGGSPSNGYKGCVDDILIYNRALTKNEIAQIFKMGGWTGN